MNETEISWTQLTWNPMSGCRKVSEECARCYAERLAEDKRGSAAFPRGFDLTLREHKLSEPRKIKKPSLIFTNSMSDLGLEELPELYFDRIIDEVEETPRHRYQTLTKRPEVLYQRFARRGRPIPASMWIGVTVGHPKRLGRLQELQKFRGLGAKVLFVSAEPLLGDLSGVDCRGLDWLIVGGESGRHASRATDLEDRFLVRRGGKGERAWIPREDRVPWVRRLRDEAARAGCPLWFKQWGGPLPTSGGRLLDGRTHDGMPTVPGAMPDGYQHRVPELRPADRGQLPMFA